MENFSFGNNYGVLVLVAILSCGPGGPVPSVHAAPGPRIKVLEGHIKRDKGNEAKLLQAALNGTAPLTLEERLWVFVQLSKVHKREKSPEQALAYLRQGQREAAAVPVANVFISRHLIHFLNGLMRRPEALAEFGKIAPILPSLAGRVGELDSQVEAAHGWLAGGTVMLGLGQLPEAMELLVRALAVFDTHPGQAKGQSDSLGQIAVLYFKSGNLDAALRELERAISIAEPANIPESLTLLYMRKAHFMSTKGDVEEQYKALIRARELALGDYATFNLAVIATNLSDVALQRKDYPGTLRFVEEAIPLVLKSGDRESLLICWINQGIAMNRLGKPEGLELLRKAIAEFTVMPGMKDMAADAQGALAEELARNGSYALAYAASVDYKKRSDELRQASDQKRIADSAARYEADKKQRQIELLEHERHAQSRMQLLYAVAGALGLLTVVILIISRVYLKRAYRKMEEMSLSDPLTGLRNRRYLASRIEADLAQAARQRLPHRRAHGAPAGSDEVVFILIDLDHFKSSNDVHGHAAGDAVLRQFSTLLMQEMRDADTVVRWGGEEFLIVARQASSRDMHLVAERIRSRVASHRFDIGGGTLLHKTCSIGFASFPFVPAGEAQSRWEDVVTLADQCLYAAKASGRDMWVGIAPAGEAHAMPRRGDVRLGLLDGIVLLEHSPGREVVWPEVAVDSLAGASVTAPLAA